MRWFSNQHGGRIFVVLWAILSLFSPFGCTQNSDDFNPLANGCDPHCETGTCDLSDGCGGRCACPQDNACSVDNRCVPTVACSDTCASSGALCGSVCGQECGTCEGDTTCSRGQCIPAQMPRTANDVSCVGCSLILKVLQQHTRNRDIGQVTLALEYISRDGTPSPRLGDFHIVTDKPVVLQSAVEGVALRDAGKSLYVDPSTQLPWDARSGGVNRFVAMSLDRGYFWQSGRLITMTYYVPHADFVTFRLVRRTGILSPTDADRALQSQSFDQPVVLVRR